jgi:hypothetical protein
MRWGFNLFPAFRGTGARVTYIAEDFREMRVKLPLNWRTRNYVGTIFSGSLYGAVDPSGADLGSGLNLTPAHDS